MSGLSRRQFFVHAAGALVSAKLWPKATAEELPDVPRNVIVWITGRQRADSLGCYGHPAAQTPHLDRLAGEGILFTNYRTVIPQSSPGRASLISGLYPHRHHVVTERIALDSSIATLGELIRSHTTMVTGYIGNWGLGADKTRDGFVERAIDIVPSDISDDTENDYALYLRDNGLLALQPTDVDQNHKHCMLSPYPEEHCITTYLANRALEFIDANREGSFFLMVSDPNPQPPFAAPQAWLDLHDPALIPVPSSAFEDLGGKPKYQAEGIARQRAEGLSAPEDIQSAWACYLGSISLIDKNLGRVLARLDQLEIAEDTLFIFTSDHGDLMGSHGMLGTGPLFYEELLRVPLIMRCPGKWEPARIEANVASVDVVPTLLEALSLPIPETVQGRSVLPLIVGGGSSWPNVTYAQYGEENGNRYRMRMILKNRRKYVLNLDDEDEFYDLETDIHETVNLLNDPRRTPDVEPLRKELLAWMKETGDPLLQEVEG